LFILHIKRIAPQSITLHTSSHFYSVFIWRRCVVSLTRGSWALWRRRPYGQTAER